MINNGEFFPWTSYADIEEEMRLAQTSWFIFVARAPYFTSGHSKEYIRIEFTTLAAFARRWRADHQRKQQTIGLGTFVPLHFDASVPHLTQDSHLSWHVVDFHGELTRIFHRELTRLSVMLRGSGWGQGMCDLLLFPGRCG